jgi:hypothetical protein
VALGFLEDIFVWQFVRFNKIASFAKETTTGKWPNFEEDRF